MNTRRASEMIFLWLEGWLIGLLFVIDVLNGMLEVSDSAMLQVWSWLFVFVTCWSFFSWRRWVGPLFMPFPIFLMAAIVFNGGQIFLEVFHLNPEGMIPAGGFSNSELVQTVRFVTFGIVAFHFGGVLGSWRKAVSVVAAQHSDSENELILSAMRVVGTTLLLIGLPFWLWNEATALQTSLGDSYGALYRRETAIGIFAAGKILAKFVIPGAMLAVVGYRQSRRALYILSALVGIFAVGDLVLGYRAFAIWPVIGFAWVVDSQVRRIGRRSLAIGSAFLLIFVFPLVRATRNLEGADRLNPLRLAETWVAMDNPVVGMIREMGGSMITVAYTLRYIPSEKAYDYGLEYAYAFLTIVPNVFGTGVHPTIAHGTPSNWLIWRVNEWIAERGGGLGYSFIAEAYYNFGWWAGILALAVIGLAMARIVAWLSGFRPPLGIAVTGVWVAFLSHYARGEMYGIVRPLVWYAAIPMILVIVSVKAEARRRALIPARNKTIGGGQARGIRHI